MSTEQRAFIENLQRLSVMFKDIIAIGPELSALGSLKNAKNEAQAALEAVRAQIIRGTREGCIEALARPSEKFITAAHRDAARASI